MRLRRIPAADEAVEKSEYVIHDPVMLYGHWEDVFEKKQPLHLEIGMGKGRFITSLASLHPEINYIGIEMYNSVLYRALQKLDAMGEEALSNLRLLSFDATGLTDIFGPGEINRIYLNFSDPWPKARHAKRRLTSSVFLDRYDKVLSADGQIEFKTDNRGLFDFSVEEVKTSEKWTISQITYDLHNDPVMRQGNVMTEYEEKFSAKGNPIYKMIIRRNS